MADDEFSGDTSTRDENVRRGARNGNEESEARTHSADVGSDTLLAQALAHAAQLNWQRQSQLPQTMLGFPSGTNGAGQQAQWQQLAELQQRLALEQARYAASVRSNATLQELLRTAQQQQQASQQQYFLGSFASLPRTSSQPTMSSQQQESAMVLQQLLLSAQQPMTATRYRSASDVPQMRGAFVVPQQQRPCASLSLPPKPAAASSSSSSSSALPPDRYKKWQMADNLPLLDAMVARGRRWETVKELVNAKLGTQWSYGRVKHRCRHLLQEKRAEAVKRAGADPEAFTEVHRAAALFLHRRVYGTRFHRIRTHAARESTSRAVTSSGSDAPDKDALVAALAAAEGIAPLPSMEGFPVGRIELEVLRSCDCASCASWGLSAHSGSRGEREALDLWTREKARRLHRLLQLHIEHGIDLGPIRRGMQWGDEWTDEDVEFRLRHVCNACDACLRKRKRGADMFGSSSSSISAMLAGSSSSAAAALESLPSSPGAASPRSDVSSRRSVDADDSDQQDPRTKRARSN